MYRLVETIKIRDGIPQNLYWHQLRYEHSYKALFACTTDVKLAETITIPDQFKTGVVKARFIYDKDNFTMEFQGYIPQTVSLLRVIENNEIEYSLKYTNRHLIQQMLLGKGECDDILILKNGRITDSSIANIVLYDGENWVTPEYPLLKGTARARLLDEQKIILRDIYLIDVKSYTHFRLINSMLDFDEQEMIDINCIK